MKWDASPPLRDRLLRHDLTPEESQRLAAWFDDHPGAGSLSDDIALANALRRLPPAPVPSNFNARVIGRIQRGGIEPNHPWSHLPAALSRLRPFLPAWLSPGNTVAALAMTCTLALGLGAWHWHRAQQHAEFIRNVAALRVLSAVDPATLADFDAIRGYGDGDAAIDFELLAALQ